MNKYLVSINDLPPGGKEFNLEDQEIWLGPLREFKMDCRITTPIKADISVMSADDGCLVRGTLRGAVTVPCNRCAEDASVELDAKFDEYEEIPQEEAASKNDGGESHILFDRHAPMINLAEVCWEQFMLAMPVRPLCRPDCKGLCPQCGANLNLGKCSCQPESGDSRMAVFRDMSVKNNADF